MPAGRLTYRRGRVGPPAGEGIRRQQRTDVSAVAHVRERVFERQPDALDSVAQRRGAEA